MVVMGYISDASPLHAFLPPSTPPRPLNPQVVEQSLTKALQLLHKNNLVFSDLWQVNVLYLHKEDRIFLIDFDWVGKDGEDRYSACFNPEANLGVVAWQLMEKSHDEENLRRLMWEITNLAQ